MAPDEEDQKPIHTNPYGESEFFDKLRVFHIQRGTNLDINARVNGKHIDLYKLFEIVLAKGGYDTVSSEKLAWRKVGQDFNLGQTNTAAYAFALKTVYYKNLAAFEITVIHNKEPPPKEILESISAKGGDLLSRTVDNFRPPLSREDKANGNDSDGSGDEAANTPKQERMDVDDPGSGGGRTTRGLRQAPPQRVLFQPDVSSSRQTRPTSTSQFHSPQPTAGSVNGAYGYSPSSNPNSNSFSLANYEPRPQMPLTLRPVYTPGNNQAGFKRSLEIREKDNPLKSDRINEPKYKGMMFPGTGFDGPNIYVRTLLALRSPIAEEQSYALHHLVKISHERGDKYKFEAFPGLAEGLIERALEVSTLFYNVKWEISYDNSEVTRQLHVLDGMNGTADILERIKALPKLDASDSLETEEFSRKISKVCEASLVIRNMVLLEENARYLAEQPPIRDFLAIALNLPAFPGLTELKHYALDISEQMTKYWSLDASDPLYISLLQYLESSDRGAIITTLRAICRISMNLEESNLLKGIPLSTIQRLFHWIMLEDEELVHVCLDLLYQFTAVPENVAFMLSQHYAKNISLNPLFSQLTRLLLYNAKETHGLGTMITPAVVPVAATKIPNVPGDLLSQIIQYREPERSSHWLRACFEVDKDSDITQIQLWHSYQSLFTKYSDSDQNILLAAADFIKNVSVTFPVATAQVQTIEGHQKFIIKGIRPRHLPIDAKGRLYSRCLWKLPNESESCPYFGLTMQNMWEHVMTSHVGVSRKSDGTFDIQAANTVAALQQQLFECHWADCHHYAKVGGTNKPSDLGKHLKTHLFDLSKLANLRAKANRPHGSSSSVSTPEHMPYSTGSLGRAPVYERQTTYITDTEENEITRRREASGVSLTAVLVLRNFARNIPKAAIGLEDDKGNVIGLPAKGKDGWMEILFNPLMQKLWYAMSYNRTLTVQVGELIFAIESVINE